MKMILFFCLRLSCRNSGKIFENQWQKVDFWDLSDFLKNFESQRHFFSDFWKIPEEVKKPDSHPTDLVTHWRVSCTATNLSRSKERVGERERASEASSFKAFSSKVVPSLGSVLFSIEKGSASCCMHTATHMSLLWALKGSNFLMLRRFGLLRIVKSLCRNDSINDWGQTSRPTNFLSGFFPFFDYIVY